MWFGLLFFLDCSLSSDENDDASDVDLGIRFVGVSLVLLSLRVEISWEPALTDLRPEFLLLLIVTDRLELLLMSSTVS